CGGGVGRRNRAGTKPLEGPQTGGERQRALVDRMATYVVDPPAGAPDDARALARLALTRVDSRCAKALAAATPLGDNTRAHLLETRARIRRALEAGRQTGNPRTGPPGGPAGGRMARSRPRPPHPPRPPHRRPPA